MNAKPEGAPGTKPWHDRVPAEVSGVVDELKDFGKDLSRLLRAILLLSLVVVLVTGIALALLALPGAGFLNTRPLIDSALGIIAMTGVITVWLLSVRSRALREEARKKQAAHELAIRMDKRGLRAHHQGQQTALYD